MQHHHKHLVLVKHKAKGNPTNKGLNSHFLLLEEKIKEHSFTLTLQSERMTPSHSNGPGYPPTTTFGSELNKWSEYL